MRRKGVEDKKHIEKESIGKEWMPSVGVTEKKNKIKLLWSCLGWIKKEKTLVGRPKPVSKWQMGRIMFKKAEKGLEILLWSDRITFVLMKSEDTLCPRNHLDTGVGGGGGGGGEKLCVCVWVCVCRSVHGHVGSNVYKSINVATVSNGQWLQGHAVADWQRSLWTSDNLLQWQSTEGRDEEGCKRLQQAWWKTNFTEMKLFTTGIFSYRCHVFIINEFGWEFLEKTSQIPQRNTMWSKSLWKLYFLWCSLIIDTNQHNFQVSIKSIKHM